MKEELQQKRTYTVPILLVIIVSLAILCILFYSKNLLNQQTDKTEAGKRLAEKYAYAQSYAALLREGAALMLNATNEADRLKAKEKLGEARFGLNDTGSLIGDAMRIGSGATDEQVAEALKAFRDVLGDPANVLNAVGEHEGPLTDAEKAALTAAAEAGEKADAALAGFRAPSGDGAYRIMADGGEWIDAALAVKAELEALAEAVG